MFKLLIIVLMAAVLGQILRRFAKSIRTNISDSKAGKSVHISTPIGVFDLKPQLQLDPALAGILVYPSAMRADSPPPEYDVDIQLLGQEYHIQIATYSTPSPEDIVWEFYRRELPGWQERRQGGQIRSLTQESPDGTRTVRIYARNGATHIETRFSRSQKAAAAVASSSDTRFGILR